MGTKINFKNLEEQFADDDPYFFSSLTKKNLNKQISCRMTYTNDEVHKIISKNNIVKNHFDLFSQNKDVQNISKITVKEKPDIELTTNHENVEEKNKVLEELNLKTKDIFAK